MAQMMTLNVGLDDLVESPLNARKTLDTDKLAELADSIAAHGVLQNLVVRPIDDGKYEVICGSRRLRAARMVRDRRAEAGLDLGPFGAVPVTVHELTDRQALELNLIENLQREQVSPIEEAQGFAALRKLGVSAEEIAARIGASKGYVYGRIRLDTLPEAIKRKVERDELPVTHALLAAKLPTRELQEKAVEAMINGFDGQPRPFANCKSIVAALMRSLKAARFDVADATLVPEAGACGSCPHRTGAQPALFADLVDDLDVCTLPSCFEQKATASGQRKLEEARLAGRNVLDADVLDQWGGPSDDWEDLDDVPWMEEEASLEADDAGQERKERTWRELLGEHCPPVAVVWDEKSKKVRELVDSEAAHAAARAAGVDWALTDDAHQAEDGDPDEDGDLDEDGRPAWKREADAKRAKIAVCEREAGEMLDALEVGSYTGLLRVWLTAAANLVDDSEVFTQTFERRGWRLPMPGLLSAEGMVEWLLERATYLGPANVASLALELMVRNVGALTVGRETHTEYYCRRCLATGQAADDCPQCAGAGMVKGEPRPGPRVHEAITEAIDALRRCELPAAKAGA